MKSILHFSCHLTEDQIDDALIGDLSAECAAHLDSCEACQGRLAAAGAPIASFNAVTLAWSERRSATLPNPALAWRPAWLPKALWAAGAAAVVAAGVSVPLLHREVDVKTLASAPPVAVTPTLMASTGPVDNPVAAREERIAHDNQMLENINRELDVPAAELLASEYGLQPGHARSWQAPATARN